MESTFRGAGGEVSGRSDHQVSSGCCGGAAGTADAIQAIAALTMVVVRRRNTGFVREQLADMLRF